MAGREVSTYVAVCYVGGVVDAVYAGSAKCLKNRHTRREKSAGSREKTWDAYANLLARHKAKGVKDVTIVVGFFSMVVPEADEDLAFFGGGHGPMLCIESILIRELWSRERFINRNPIALTLQGRFSRVSASAAG